MRTRPASGPAFSSSTAALVSTIVYASAMHGFTHENATGQQPGVLYDATTDARSAVAIQSFFTELFDA